MCLEVKTFSGKRNNIYSFLCCFLLFLWLLLLKLFLTVVDCCWSVVFCGSGWHFVCRVVLILYFLFYFFHSFRFDVIRSWKDSFSLFFLYLLLIFIYFFISPFTYISINSSIHSYTNIVLSINHFFTFYLTIFLYINHFSPHLFITVSIHSSISLYLLILKINSIISIHPFPSPASPRSSPVPRLQPPPATRRKISAY